jgi:hypothetical protein
MVLQETAQAESSAPEKRKLIAMAILRNHSEYRADVMRWSFTYHFCLFCSAALGALAGLVLKLEFFLSAPDDKKKKKKKDLAAALAMASPLLITFVTLGNFQTYWQANRLAAAQVENLGYELALDDQVNLADFSRRLREISIVRNQEIVGSNSEARTPTGTPTASVAPH